MHKYYLGPVLPSTNLVNALMDGAGEVVPLQEVLSWHAADPGSICGSS